MKNGITKLLNNFFFTNEKYFFIINVTFIVYKKIKTENKKWESSLLTLSSSLSAAR